MEQLINMSFITPASIIQSAPIVPSNSTVEPRGRAAMTHHGGVFNTFSTSGARKNHHLGAIVSTSIDPGVVEIRPVDGNKSIKTTTLEHSTVIAFLNYQAKGETAVTYIKEGDIVTDVTGTGNAWMEAIREAEKRHTSPVKVGQRVGKRVGRVIAMEDSILPIGYGARKDDKRLGKVGQPTSGSFKRNTSAKERKTLQPPSSSTMATVAKPNAMKDMTTALPVTFGELRNQGIPIQVPPFCTPKSSKSDIAVQRQRRIAAIPAREEAVYEKEWVDENTSHKAADESIILAPVPKRVSDLTRRFG